MLNGSRNVLSRIFQKFQIWVWKIFHFQNSREIQILECGFEMPHRIAEYCNKSCVWLHNLIHDISVESCMVAQDVGKDPVK